MKSAKPTDKELLELGKRLQAFYDMGYVNKKEALKWAFLKGIAAGFGAIIGSTIVIGLVLWVLSLFNELPFIGPIDHALHSALRR